MKNNQQHINTAFFTTLIIAINLFLVSYTLAENSKKIAIKENNIPTKNIQNLNNTNLDATLVSPPPTPITPTKIGVILPMTGSFLKYGQLIRSGLEEGNSCNLKFIFEDESCSAAKALTAYKKITEIDKTKIIIGPYCGSPQLTLAPHMKNRGQLNLLASSAPEKVYELSNKNSFSTQHTIEDEARFMANYLNGKNISSVSVVFLDNEFSRAHYNEFKKVFTGKILNLYTYSDESLSELSIIATKISKNMPQALYVPDAFPLMNGLTKQLTSKGVSNLKIYSVYSAKHDDVKNALNSYSKNLFLTYPLNPEIDGLSYFSKLASQIICKSLEECSNTDNTCIKNSWQKNQEFNDFGALTNKFKIITIKKDKFIELRE